MILGAGNILYTKGIYKTYKASDQVSNLPSGIGGGRGELETTLYSVESEMENNSYSGKPELAFWIYLEMQLLQNLGDTVGMVIKTEKGRESERSFSPQLYPSILWSFSKLSERSDIVSIRWQIRETMKTGVLSFLKEIQRWNTLMK